MNSIFDEIARTLAEPTGRRKALRNLGWLAAVPFLGMVGARRAQAACNNCGSCGCTVGQQCFCPGTPNTCGASGTTNGTCSCAGGTLC